MSKTIEPVGATTRAPPGQYFEERKKGEMNELKT